MSVTATEGAGLGQDGQPEDEIVLSLDDERWRFLSLWYPSALMVPREEVEELIAPSQPSLRVSEWVGGSPSQICFTSAGHFVVFCGTLCVGDVDRAKGVLKAEEPDEQVRLARKAGLSEAPMWARCCHGVVDQVNRWKFFNDEDLRRGLLSVGTGWSVSACAWDESWRPKLSVIGTGTEYTGLTESLKGVREGLIRIAAGLEAGRSNSERD